MKYFDKRPNVYKCDNSRRLLALHFIMQKVLNIVDSIVLEDLCVLDGDDLKEFIESRHTSEVYIYSLILTILTFLLRTILILLTFSYKNVSLLI